MMAHILKSLQQLFDPAMIKVLFVCALISLLILFFLGGGLYWGMMQVPFSDIPWIGGWLVTSTLGDWVLSATMLAFTAITGVFVFPYILLFVSSFFQERIIGLVEDKHYPNLPAPMGQRMRDEWILQLKFLAKVIGVNVIFTPLYLVLMFTGFGAVLLSALVNGYLIGVEYYSMVGLRRLSVRQHEESVRQNRVTVHFTGVLIYALMLMPFINLLMPVFACMIMTHLFHRYHAEDGFMMRSQD